MKTVRGLLNEKGSVVWSTTPNSLVFDALEQMDEKNVGALLVLEGEKLVGIMSERDYARKVILKGKCSRDILVKDIMTYNVISVNPDQTVHACLKLISDKHVRHLPVVQDDKVIGIVSIGDLVNAIIAEQKTLIQRLEQFILENKSLT